MRKSLFKIISIAVILIIIILSLSSFIIDFQWFKEVGYLNVFLTSFKAKIIIFLPTLIVLYSLITLYSIYLRNSYLKIESVVYDKSRNKKQNRIIYLISFIISFFVSLAFTGGFWYRILEFLKGKSFGYKDPIFKLDASFYVFKLPLIEGVLSILITIIIILIIVTLTFYSIVRVREGISSFRGLMDIKSSSLVRFIAKQLSIFGAIFLLLLSAAFYIKGLNIVYSPRGVAFGASYTDVHVTLPMYRIISILCIAASIVIAFSIIRKKVKMIIATAVFIVALIIFEGLLSGIVEKFIVSPNARDKEMPYLTYNIEATRRAFNLENLAEKDFNVTNTLTSKDLEENKGTIENIRIAEFSQVLDVYNQIQAIRNYYKFNDVDIDRYIIDGKKRQIFISARELDNSNREQRFQTWQNKHLFYTHGYGAVASFTNVVNSSGLPDFILRDIPSSGMIKLDKPQIYFGELSNDYIIVDAKSNEIDYPSGNDNKETRYDGSAGIYLNPLNRLLFTVNQGSLNFLLSNDITSKSRVILNRNIVSRVKKIAPFIGYDSDPYLVLSEGRLYWIIDGYTTTDRFPYSEPYNGVNYIRNSVKVVVDAYNGDVKFYLADKNDAIAKTIGAIYSNIFKDIDDMPKDLKEHIRYSEDVFLLQASVFERYHMKNPITFYNSEDLWSIAKYKGQNGQDVNVDTVYQIMRLPGEEEEEFLLTIPYTVAKKENMVSLLAVRMDKNLSQLVLIKFPKEKAIYGPSQFNSKLNTDTNISSARTLWGQQGSEVVLGEVNIIPIGNSILYVRPLYIRAQSGKSLPELKKVIIGYGDKIVMEDNIEKALLRLFNEDYTKPSQPIDISETENNAKDLAKKAQELFNNMKESQRNGDWAGYGEYLKQLENIINKLNETVE
ncbi:hypothetical protein SAMN05443428_14115 [Caloramator quimbayensis]|uniref:UPF0182 protein SAMN05443428_14115 n=1 Tax=Caloramator quimbayensis TaxID=1147123 RepID=A0A1T4YEJ1_9CLOT|nr:UPF0182 family protein [Caloramator quimbayensis]SKB00110.1 hypothetical protein SAMN05443428_14115 [Caloramator quimbayensis]